MTKKLLLTSLVVYILVSGVSYFLFANVLGGGAGIIDTPVGEPKKDGGKLVFDDSLPKTEPCPLNGALWSKQQKAWWEKHRPLGVMIENHDEARPQSGLTSADIVYESVAEGGITRFLAIYHCQDAEYVGPVRSARTYFLDWVSEYGDSPLYAHVGGANTPGPADALGQIRDYGWYLYNDLNQFSLGAPVFKRIEGRLKRANGADVATEHTMYSSTTALWGVGEDRKLTNENEDGASWDETYVPYKFKKDQPAATPQASTVSYSFWDGYAAFDVSWKYDKATNSYLRSNGGKPHMDKNNNKQITAKNVIVLFQRESRANDGYEGNLHMLYGTKGTGKATIFMDGKEINGTWSKKDRTSKTIIRDASGEEVEFNPGMMWFSIIATGSDITTR